jgi:glycosyltransferase involved in cell wall biosynthesis
MKIAITHDWLYGGGAEKVVEALHELYPDAPIYTSYCTEEWRKKLHGRVVTGYLNRWPFSKLRKFLPLMRQQWFKSLDLSDFDVVISSCGNGEARFVLPKKPRGQKPLHIAYTHSPTHFYWRKYDQYLANPGFRPKWLVRLALRLLVARLRRADWQAAQNPDVMIANSTHIQSDIKRYYGRDSVVVHPPVDTNDFRPSQTSGTYYVMWGRHVPYKRFDLAIDACTRLNKRLIVLGEGPETKSLKQRAGKSVEFMGKVSSADLKKWASEGQAFLFPGEEDFGIAPVEAMAAGLPIIAFGSGGALDYVKDGENGVLFSTQTVDDLCSAIKKFETLSFDKNHISACARSFSKDVFMHKISSIVSDTLQEIK